MTDRRHLARRGDPATSKEAAELADLNGSQEAVLRGARELSTDWTDLDMEYWLERNGYLFSAARARHARLELQDLGVIAKVGERVQGGRRRMTFRLASRLNAPASAPKPATSRPAKEEQVRRIAQRLPFELGNLVVDAAMFVSDPTEAIRRSLNREIGFRLSERNYPDRRTAVESIRRSLMRAGASDLERWRLIQKVMKEEAGRG